MNLLVSPEQTVETGPHYHIGSFDGPLDLLLHLIEKNQVNIYDIPIAEITRQYLEYLPLIQQQEKDEVSSSFLVMASTLLYIKSRMLLPGRTPVEGADEDPRADLVMRLLEYRRCQWLGKELQARRLQFSSCRRHRPLTPEEMGIERVVLPPPPVQTSAFENACMRIVQRNALRFQDIRSRMHHLLRQDRTPLKQRIRGIWERVRQLKRLFFFEVIPASAQKSEKVSGFLALLELLRLNQIQVTQEEPFDPILIETNPEANPDELDAFLRDQKEEEGYV